MRKLAEEKRRKQEAAAKAAAAEAQRVAAERAAAAAAAKRREVLVNRMQVWGRTGFGLVVKGCAKGLPMAALQQQQQQTNKNLSLVAQNAAFSKVVLKQSTWGGASMCRDGESALVGALKRHLKGG